MKPETDHLFSRLMQEHRGILFKVSNAYCPNKDDRDDLVQEIVYQLWKSWPSYNDSYKFSTWMYRIALNVSISFYRKTKKAAPVSPFGDRVPETVDDTAESRELAGNLHKLEQFIQELKELDRALMILYLEEKSHREIAEILGITETNVSTKIGRIKEILKEKFKHVNQ